MRHGIFVGLVLRFQLGVLVMDSTGLLPGLGQLVGFQFGVLVGIGCSSCPIGSKVIACLLHVGQCNGHNNLRTTDKSEICAHPKGV